MRDAFTMNGSGDAGGPSGVSDGAAGGAAGRREIVLAQEKPFQLADTQVRPAALEVEFGSQTTSIEPRVMQVLVALSRTGGGPVSRETLIECCWGGRVVTDGALNRSVAQLRKALRDPGIQVDTIPKVGYRLLAAAASVRADLSAGAGAGAGAGAALEGRALKVAPGATSSTDAGAAAFATTPSLRPASASGAPALSDGAATLGDRAAAFGDDASASTNAQLRSWQRRALRGALIAAALALTGIAVWRSVPSRNVIWTASNYRPLTSTAEQETYPALSPEGTQIVYATRANAYGARDLYLRNVNEGTPVQLTSDASDEYGAAWSPDGGRIAFARSIDDEPCALVIMPIPRGPERIVTRCEGGAEAHPSWLDSRTLLFSDRSPAQPVPRVRAVDIETGAVRDLTSPSGVTLGDTDPQAAPDGHHVAFRRTRITGADDLLVLDTDSGKEHALTRDGWKASGYVWSSDSRYVFFSSNRGGEFGLWSVDALGRTPPRQVSLGLGTISFAHISMDRQNRVAVEITRGHSKLARVSPSGDVEMLMAGAGSDGEPAVAGDGAIAHVSNRSGTYEMWMSGGDAAPVRLTSIGGSYILDPGWSADGNDVAFVGVKGRSAEIYTVARDGSRLQQRTSNAVAKRSPVFAASGQQLLYLERNMSGGWQLMELDLKGSAPPRAVPAGEGWVGLRSAPDGTVFGRRAGEGSVRFVSPAAPIGSAVPPAGFAPTLALQLSDNDTWAIGKDGVYVRRARRIDRASSIWLFPWHGTERRIADVPLASGNIAVAPSGDVLVSQGTTLDMDLAMLELKPVS
jgi:Tol biopolymer transport system component/DNA-binding winged helix-turn-helix (wHTH) protein